MSKIAPRLSILALKICEHLLYAETGDLPKCPVTGEELKASSSQYVTKIVAYGYAYLKVEGYPNEVRIVTETSRELVANVRTDSSGSLQVEYVSPLGGGRFGIDSTLWRTCPVIG